MRLLLLALLFQASALLHVSSLPSSPSFPEQYSCDVFIVSAGNISSPHPDGLLYSSVMYSDSSTNSAALRTQYGESAETQIFSWAAPQPQRFVRDDVNSVFSASFCSAGPTTAPSLQGSLFLPITEHLEYVSPSSVNGRPCSLFVSPAPLCFVLPVPVQPEHTLCGRQWLCSDDHAPLAFMVESAFSSDRDDRPAAAAAAAAEMSRAASNVLARTPPPALATSLPRAMQPQKFLREVAYRASSAAAAAAAAHDKIIVVYASWSLLPPSPSVFNTSHAKPCGQYDACFRRCICVTSCPDTAPAIVWIVLHQSKPFSVLNYATRSSCPPASSPSPSASSWAPSSAASHPTATSSTITPSASSPSAS
jgi:hypothetical protein